MELRHLRYFVAAGQEEHFGKAAARLRIVQPALSKQIRELEEELGVLLFERLPRGVKLSRAGRAFLPEAIAILARVDSAAGLARDVGQGRAGSLCLGFVDTAMYHPSIPRLIHSFRSEYPSIRLDLRQAPSVAQWELLYGGQLDAGLVYHLPREDGRLVSLRIGRERICLAVPAHHPLATRKKLRMEMLKDEPFVWFPRSVSPPFNDSVMEACRRHAFTPRVVQEAGTDHAIISLVAAGVGLTFCIDSARFSKPQGVEVLEISDLGLAFDLSLCWLKDQGNPALAGLRRLSRLLLTKPPSQGQKKGPHL